MFRVIYAYLDLTDLTAHHQRGCADLAKLWSLGHLTSLNLMGATNLSRVAMRAFASLPILRCLNLSHCPLVSHSMLADLSR